MLKHPPYVQMKEALMLILIWYTLIPQHQNYSTVRPRKRREVCFHLNLKQRHGLFSTRRIFFLLFMILLNENFVSLRNMSWKATITLWQDDVVIDYSCKSFLRTNYVIFCVNRTAVVNTCMWLCTLLFVLAVFAWAVFAVKRTESWRTRAREKTRAYQERVRESESVNAYIHTP